MSGYPISISNISSGIKNFFSAIPLVGSLGHHEVKKKPANFEEAVRTQEAADQALDQLDSPSTEFNCCGLSKGVWLYILFGASVGTLIGGGTALWKQGDDQDNQVLITAGKIMALYLALPAIVVGCLIHMCIGACVGDKSKLNTLDEENKILR